jgi:hypothetical protein
MLCPNDGSQLDDDYRVRHGRKRKTGGFFGDLFDFD